MTMTMHTFTDTFTNTLMLRIASRVAMVIVSAIIWRVARAPRRSHGEPSREG